MSREPLLHDCWLERVWHGGERYWYDRLAIAIYIALVFTIVGILPAFLLLLVHERHHPGWMPLEPF